jgi:hypothetical protein
MTLDHDVAAVRVALLDAIARERPRRRRRPLLAGALTLAVLGSATGALAATGVIFAPPKVDHTVPAVAVWTYYAKNPYGHGEGPVLMSAHPEALARANHAAEQALAAKGVTAQCGADADHPLACYLPSGDLVDGNTLFAAITRPNGTLINELAPSDYDVKPLSTSEAHAWLCTHPEQRPGADGGEKPAPPMAC